MFCYCPASQASHSNAFLVRVAWPVVLYASLNLVGALLLKGGAMVSEQPGRDRHRWKTLLLTIFTLLLVFCAVFAVVAFVTPLDKIGFLRFPLGFFLLAQGLLIGMVALAFWSTRMQELFDRRLNEGEDL